MLTASSLYATESNVIRHLATIIDVVSVANFKVYNVRV